MYTIKHAILAGTALFVLAPSLPALAQREVVVQPAPSLKAWSVRVSRDLDRQLDYTQPISLGPNRQGLVRINFECSDTGAPTKAAIARSSGARELDRAALRAVQRIPTLHPLADGISHDQRYAAVVVFANSEDSRDRMLSRYAKQTGSYAFKPKAEGIALAMVGPIPPSAR